ncbi:hypothetical protein GCK32_002255 [Trichostrongylus colubriformis]|uniref:Uncharacterized protein n=1 Tax=Trichostrongylus colubriformis TaxID=6319 RepID=A0AAN8G718_TRICO
MQAVPRLQRSSSKQRYTALKISEQIRFRNVPARCGTERVLLCAWPTRRSGAPR